MGGYEGTTEVPKGRRRVCACAQAKSESGQQQQEQQEEQRGNQATVSDAGPRIARSGDRRLGERREDTGARLTPPGPPRVPRGVAFLILVLDCSVGPIAWQ